MLITQNCRTLAKFYVEKLKLKRVKRFSVWLKWKNCLYLHAALPKAKGGDTFFCVSQAMQLKQAL
jgi:hypothetical protein